MKTRIFFTSEIPDLGGSVYVKNSVENIRHKLRLAQRNELPTIEVTTILDNHMTIPTHLIGPSVEEN